MPITGDSPSLIVQLAGDPLGALLKVGLFTIHGNARGGRTVPVHYTSPTGFTPEETYASYDMAALAERKRLAADADVRRTGLERRLGELSREIDRLVNAIARGHGDPAVLGP